MFKSPGQAPMAGPLHEPQPREQPAEVKSAHVSVIGFSHSHLHGNPMIPLRTPRGEKRMSASKSVGQKSSDQNLSSRHENN